MPGDSQLAALHNDVEEILECLERRVLQLRFGLIDSYERTLEGIGNRFGLTRERIRQIEANAFRKLRRPSRSKKLKIGAERRVAGPPRHLGRRS